MADFETKTELRTFISINTPMAIKPTRDSRTKLISPFTSGNAQVVVIDTIVDALWDRLNKKK